MNNYITLDGKKYMTPAKFWQPYVDKPATVRKTLMGATDVTFGPAVTEEWRGQIEGPVTPEDDGTPQIETITLLGAITTGGWAQMIITAEGATLYVSALAVLGRPLSELATTFAYNINHSVDLVDFQSKYTASSSGADIVLTAKQTGVGDATLNMHVRNDGCQGLTEVLTSQNTAPGTNKTYGTIDDLRAVIAGDLPVPFIDHYGNSCTVVVLGPFAERSLASKWDSPTNVIFLQVRLVKV